MHTHWAFQFSAGSGPPATGRGFLPVRAAFSIWSKWAKACKPTSLNLTMDASIQQAAVAVRTESGKITRLRERERIREARIFAAPSCALR